MLVRCLPASVQSARSVFEKNTHDLRAFHSTTDSTDLTDKICLEGNTERSESNPGRSLGIKAWRGGLSGRQYQADKNRADKISIDKNKEKTAKNIFLYFYLLIFYTTTSNEIRNRVSAIFHSSLFTFHFSLKKQVELCTQTKKYEKMLR